MLTEDEVATLRAWLEQMVYLCKLRAPQADSTYGRARLEGSEGAFEDALGYLNDIFTYRGAP